MLRQEKGFAAVVLLTVLAVATVVAFAPLPAKTPAQTGSLTSFSTYDEMKAYVQQGLGRYQRNVETYAGGIYTATGSLASAPAALSAVSGFTTTNVQVQGVDEPDLVKTDGTYIFVASGSSVSVVKAVPADNASVVSRLDFAGPVIGLFISPGRLLVIVNGQANQNGTYIQQVQFQLYDDSRVSGMSLIKSVSVQGSYVDSRLTSGYMYAIVQQPTYAPVNSSFVAPSVMDGKVAQPINATDVYYNPSSASSFSMYTIVLSMSITDGAHSENAVLTGWGSTVYSSTSSIYLAFPDVMGYPIAVGIALPAVGVVQRGVPIFWGGAGGNTTLFRIGFLDGTTQVEATGVVAGTVLNQFSMDEYQGYLRVATTSYQMLQNQSQVQVNNVYVLNQDMKMVGSLEGLAPGEHIYAVRFLGDVGYVVTFEQIDPLFAISLSDPAKPTVLSALELTGFSDYLHPIGNGYLIGVGKETVPAPQEAGYVLYLGLKFSLFHVFDNGTSVEVSRFLVGDRGSDSPVLSDHRAFVYDAGTGIMAVPLLIAKVQGGGSTGSTSYGTPVWQGVYLFHVSTTGGFELLGNITQMGSTPPDSKNTGLAIDRVVLIGGYVYTVSTDLLMVSSLSNFSTVSSVKLPG